MKVLIIEDENAAARRLEKLLTELDADILVLQKIDTVELAVAWLQSNPQPDLIFLDIHLADGSSFDIFEHVNVTCPVIFTTAYDEYALQAFKVNAVDYLLKPIKSSELATALAGENKHFHAVLHGVNLEKIRSKGLHYLPVEDLQNVEKFLDEAGAVVHGAWNRLSVGGMVQGMTMRMQYEQAGAEPAKPSSAEPQASELTAGLNVPAETQLARLGESLYAAFSQQGGYHSPWPEMPSTFAVLSELNSEYLLTKEGRLGFVILRLSQ